MTGKVVRGLGWSVASSVCVQVSRAVTAVLLARLLTPEEFGIAAIVLVFSGLALVFTDLALGAGLIQRSDITERDRSTVFWSSLGIGAVFTLLGLALSGPVAGFFGEPDLQALVAVFSATFLLNGLSTTQATLLQRSMDFRSLELRIIASTLAGAAAAIAIAAAGGGAWAVVGQALVATALSTVLLWTFSSWRPRFVYSLESLRRLGAFGMGIFGARVVWFANRNIDTVLIGRFLGSAPLGAYAVAFNLMLFPISRIAQPIQRVLFPAMSRLQEEPERLARGWLRASRIVAAIALPPMLGMIVVAPEFVRVVLGEKWAPAIPVLQLLALVGVMQAVQQISAVALQARGRAATILGFTVAALVANVVAFVIGLPFGIVGVAAAYVVSTALIFAPFLVVCAREVGVSAGRYLRALGGSVVAAIAMMQLVAVTRLGLIEAGAADPAILLASVAAGMLAYPIAVYFVDPDLRREAQRAIARLRGTDGSGVTASGATEKVVG